MIFIGIILLVVGVLILAISILLCLGFISLLHDYHRTNIKEEDKKKCGLSIGLSLSLFSITSIATGIIVLVTTDESILKWMMIAFIISLAISVILSLLFVKKYNGSIFG